VTASFYLTGICPLLLLLVPPLEIYLELRPMNLDITVWTWAVYYAGFYVMQIVLAWFAVGSFRWETLTLATVSFPIYVKALWNVLTGKDVGWYVTGSASTRSPFNYAIPQILFFVFLALTTVVGVWRDADNGVFTLATAWNATNTVILGAFLMAAMRESHHLRHPRERLPVVEAPAEAEPITVVARPLPLAAAEPAPASAEPAAASSRRRSRQLSPTGGRS
jgi:cellulose synthase (UDP-forming)